MKVVEHIEHYIGKISRGLEILNKKYNITISLYDDIPFEGIKTYTTLGFNRYFVNYYSEFIFVCKAKYSENEIASFLTSFSEYVIDFQKEIKRGEVIQFDFNITSETKMNSLYFSLPFYFNDNLQELKLQDRSIIFPLIIPIYNDEAVLIREKGWESFENFLEDNEVNDLWDLDRNEYFW